MASISCTMDAMSPTSTRRRIHVTETRRLAAIIDRQAYPGEPRASTLVRLAERADSMTALDADFLVFHPNRPPLTTGEVGDLLMRDELDSLMDGNDG